MAGVPGAGFDHPIMAQAIERLRDVLTEAVRIRLVADVPLGAFLSGSGSTICAITLQDRDRIAAAMKRAAGSISSRVIITRADNHGAKILTSH